MTRAATTLADPCTGAQRRDFLLGLRHGQLVRAHVPSWCSGHGMDAGCSQRAGPPGQLTARRYQTPAEGTGVDAVHERDEGAVVGRGGHEAMGHNHLMGGIDRDLNVVALHKAVPRRKDAAVRVGYQNRARVIPPWLAALAAQRGGPTRARARWGQGRCRTEQSARSTRLRPAPPRLGLTAESALPSREGSPAFTLK